jgi:hypothetical protein
VRYEVSSTITVPIEAEPPEDAALEFASQLEAGELNREAVIDRDENDEAVVDVSEETADGRQVTYHIALGSQLASVRWINEDRPFRFSSEEER